jgi:hypothetical protein
MIPAPSGLSQLLILINMSRPPAIDFTTIRFPTDRLTISDLRRVYPCSFDQPPEIESSLSQSAYGRASIEEALGRVIDAERAIASTAFKKLTGQTLTEDEATRDKAGYQYVIDEYIDLGLARGAYQAEQLLRDIVGQAQEQAAPMFPPHQ